MVATTSNPSSFSNCSFFEETSAWYGVSTASLVASRHRRAFSTLVHMSVVVAPSGKHDLTCHGTIRWYSYVSDVVVA